MRKHEIGIYICSHLFGPDQSAKTMLAAAMRGSHGCVVDVQSVPCSGKTDVIYMLRAFEGGLKGLALITCPPGQCRNVEGNYRAIVRMGHVAKLLDEIGLGGKRLAVLHAPGVGDRARLEELVEQAVERLAQLPPNPVAGGAQPAQVEHE